MRFATALVGIDDPRLKKKSPPHPWCLTRINKFNKNGKAFALLQAPALQEVCELMAPAQREAAAFIYSK